MAIALVTSYKDPGGSSVNTTGATLLWALVSAGPIYTALTDAYGNTYTIIGTKQSQSVADESAAYYVNGTPTVGSGHTWSSSPGAYCGICALAFSGVLVSSALDGYTESGNQASAASPGSLTPSVNNCVVVLGNGGFWTSGASVNGGFTLQQEVLGSGGINYSGSASYLIQTTATAANPALTAAGGQTIGCHQAAFQPVTGGGGATLMSRLTMLGVR